MARPVGLQQVENPGNRVVHLYGRVTLDASGQAVVATTAASKGIPQRFSVARTGAGLYTITLFDKFLTLLGYSINATIAGAVPIGRASMVRVVADNSAATPPTINIQASVPASTTVIETAADLPNNTVLSVWLALDRGRI